MRPIYILLATVSISLSSCGYTVGRHFDYRDIQLNTFDNRTERRGEEAELTRRISAALVSNGIRIANDAPYVLGGEIVNITQPQVIPGKLDVTVIGSYNAKVHFFLVERATGKVVLDDVAEYNAEFAGLRTKTVENAKEESYQQIAEAIVSKLEAKW